MTDRELLELAAKAAGYYFHGHRTRSARDDVAGYENCYVSTTNDTDDWFVWSPLTDDGDALRLAVTCGLVVDCSRPSAGEPWKQHAIWLDETMSNAELTRRAIVRAAAEIGKGMI